MTEERQPNTTRVDLPLGMIEVRGVPGGFMLSHDGDRELGPFNSSQIRTSVWCTAQCHFRSTVNPYFGPRKMAPVVRREPSDGS